MVEIIFFVLVDDRLSFSSQELIKDFVLGGGGGGQGRNFLLKIFKRPTPGNQFRRRYQKPRV